MFISVKYVADPDFLRVRGGPRWYSMSCSTARSLAASLSPSSRPCNAIAFLLRCVSGGLRAAGAGAGAGRGTRVLVAVATFTLSGKCDGADTKGEVTTAADWGKACWDASAGLLIGGSSKKWSSLADDGVSSWPLCERGVDAG